jgi:type I restriction enzyme M protein
MLDTDTKRRIDTARDILVGKVPDPKSQVEQITIALIYKFMDDMDAEAEELGGKRKFFTGEFERYGWAKLMRSGLGGHETLALYSEGIDRMPENPGIPPLFRDIFKNAYLPYRDPETLKAFLKIIDEFTYDHSERLGDAFEYLLSVLGSQGDAGQFRTPRHIIDFIVRILDPKKEESVLDPACGTAGFLISAWKHILAANTDKQGVSTLTPDERGNLARNFKGYDISPDMVRLSLVNLYLHGFTDPHIYEYDTLTSEERWNEFADVILANPPFMSPKGGIKPHKRFSIQAKRSEVLFVDYMAEHLSTKGRAGIIVPEGIIFQSQGAYTELRKMLIENSLVAVISLPAGCFNPYSGVKTSILILDKSLAKQSKTIAFFKVENDGYGLGAQRRAIEKNDLPKVQEELQSYLAALRIATPVEELDLQHGLIVPKEKIAANGDYNLSGERYREGTSSHHEFPMVRIGDVCEINPKKSEVGNLAASTQVSFVPMADLGEHQMLFAPKEQKPLSEVGTSYTYFRDNDVLLAKVTPCFENGKAGIARELRNGLGFGSSEFYVLRPLEQILPEYIYFCVTHSRFRESAIQKMTGTGGLQRVPRECVEAFQIPLPPLEIQKEIIAEIEGYQKVINGARAVLDNYRPHIPIKPDWPLVPISDVSIRITKGSSPTWQGIEYTSSPSDILFVTSENVGQGELLLDSPKYVERRFNEIEPKSILKKGDVLTNIVGASIGRTAIFDIDADANVNQAVCVIRPNFELIISKYLMTLLNSPYFIQKLLGNSVENARANVSMGVLGGLTIPLPTLAEQQAIVAEIEAEQALVNANRDLITRFEAKIQTTLSRIWGKDEVTSRGRA